MNVIFVRALNGELTDTFKQNGFAAIGWLQEPIPDFSNWEALTQRLRLDHPQGSPTKIGVNVGQISRFMNEIKIGTIVVTSYRDGGLLIGKATGEPYFQSDSICRFFLRVNVDWIDNKFDRRLLDIPTQNTIRSSLSVFRVLNVHEITELARITNTSTIVQSLVNEENLIEAIRLQLLQLEAVEFEIFVSYVMQSLGFEPTQRQGGSGDGGTDVEGTLDVDGFASIKLQIQVKRYTDSIIGESEIRRFRGSLKRDFQGTFITLSKFNNRAKESASSADFPTIINLIDGKQLIKVFIDRFDKIMKLIEENEHSFILDKLRFKKIIIPQ